MFNTLVNVQRPEGTTVLSGLRVKVDQLTMKEMVEHGQLTDFRSHDNFKVYTEGWPSNLLQKEDVLIDQQNTDPITGAAYKYRVVMRPKSFERDHQELLVEVVIGT
jgi:hypothetical protein